MSIIIMHNAGRSLKYHRKIVDDGEYMACKLGLLPAEHGRCDRWVGTHGMSSQPTLGNICEYCVNNG